MGSKKTFRTKQSLRESDLTMCKNTASFSLLTLMAIIAGVCVDSTHARDTGSSPRKYKAAVYAHAAIIPKDEVPVSRAKALEVMQENLAVFKTQAQEAFNKSVDILVFPEDGVYGMRFDRETINPYLEYMPDPSQEAWIPCDDPDRYKNTEVQQSLSCMAKENHLYLVANIGDKQPCDPSKDKACPKDRRYQYNTDVAYGPDGTFLAKYHKYNLFYEDQFDTPAPEHVYFDTPFGRFGMMTCFDVLFREPGVSLVEEHKVTNIAFPTAWMDALPLLPAIGFHSSFAREHGINFLAANIHLPKYRFDGSGLYGPKGAHAFHYSSLTSGGGAPKLVIADMDVIDQPILRVKTQAAAKSTTKTSIGVADDSSTSAEFRSILFGDTYTFKPVSKPSGKVSVCQGDLCCRLEYAIEEDTFTADELFAFGAFDGLHSHEGTYYMQNCVLVKCPDAKNKSSCGSYAFDSSTVFSKLSLHGQFQTPYVYPQVILSDPQGNLAISKPDAWTFTGSAIETSSSFKAPVLNAVLLARNYKKDTGPLGDSGSRLLVPVVLLATGLVVAVALTSLLQTEG